MKIYEKIDEAYDNLSKSHKILSTFVRNNKNIIPFLNINELSEESGVSTATITRFAKRIGFKGYLDFQQNLKNELTHDIVSFEELRSLNKSVTDESNVLAEVIYSNIDALTELSNSNLDILIDEVTDMIISSKDIYIVSSRSSFSAGYYLYFLLKSIRKNTFLINNMNDNVSIDIQYASKEDLLISISYSKYTSFTSKVTEYFSAKKSKIVSITDSFDSPISKYSDKTLIAKNGEKSFSFVATFTVINALIMLYSKKVELNEDIFDKQDLVANYFNVYVDTDQNK